MGDYFQVPNCGYEFLLGFCGGADHVLLVSAAASGERQSSHLVFLQTVAPLTTGFAGFCFTLLLLLAVPALLIFG